MRVYLIGCGCSVETLTVEARAAIDAAPLLVGAPRLLALFPHKTAAAAITAAQIAAALDGTGDGACVLFSGDSGFYSGARKLLPLLSDREVTVLPGLSSLQLLSARLQRPWQDWRLCSAHGVDCDVVAAVCGSQPAFFLTGGKTTPDGICARLCEAGLAELPVTVGENLGCPDERILSGTAGELAGMRFAPLNVLLCEAAPRPAPRTPGLPDACFARVEGVPMTKQSVRAAILSELAVTPTDLCWDIGAGTGSVSVELALQSRAVYGVERDQNALAAAEKNRRRLGAWNLRLIAGTAPEALAGLPTPDAVFVGGSGGRLPEILDAVRAANPAARVCVSAIALETLHTAIETLRGLGYAVTVTQLSVSRSRPAGELTLMLAQNSVWLVTGTAP